MSKIKSREVIKDIKVLDKAASGTAHVKNAFIRSKSAAEETQQSLYDSPERQGGGIDYAYLAAGFSLLLVRLLYQ